MCLLKPGAYLIRVRFNAIACFQEQNAGVLKTGACLIEVVTMTGSTVYTIL